MARHVQGRIEEQLRCSFCEKLQSDVRKLIAGPHVFICDECVRICQDVIAENAQEKVTADLEPPTPLPHGSVTGPLVQCALCGTVTPPADVVLVRNRGVLCLGCIGEVEAAVAERRESES